MLVYTTLKQKPKEFLALTGLTRQEFDEVLARFEACLPQPPKRRKRRQRAPGGGRKSGLPTPADKLLFVLVYMKTYPIQAVQAQLFEMSQPSANRYLRQLLPVLAQALEGLGVMPEREGAQVAHHERQYGEPLDLTVDGVERRRQRPKHGDLQAIHYSGKKKTHADKNIVVVNTRTQRVSFLSPTLPGAVHDKSLADYVQIHYPPEAKLRSDLGFYGYRPQVRQHLQPKKSPRPVNCGPARNVETKGWLGCASELNTPLLGSRSAASLKMYSEI